MLVVRLAVISGVARAPPTRASLGKTLALAPVTIRVTVAHREASVARKAHAHRGMINNPVTTSPEHRGTKSSVKTHAARA